MDKLRIVNDIRTLRFLSGEMTQTQLGHRVGLTRQTIAAIESGKYSPSLEAAFRIAEVFGKRIDEVFRHESPDVKPDVKPDTKRDDSGRHAPAASTRA
ncbi:MAG: helix-turn-helix transcriptional regulator [Phycisphaeraceae bacterium]|nr:helix-turn-helix transcriptional regulator [Phycisphaeraceae bacterium]